MLAEENSNAEEAKNEDAMAAAGGGGDNATNDNAGGDGSSANAEEGDKPSSSNLILFIVIGVLSLLLVISLVLMFTPLGDGILGRNQQQNKTENIKANKTGEVKEDIDPILDDVALKENAEGNEENVGKDGKPIKKDVIFAEMSNIIINIKSPSRRTKFLKLSIYFEVDSESIKSKIEKMKPRIVDQFQLYARNLDPEDLEGAVGLQRLRVELLKRANRVMAPDKVHNILFREIIIQ